MRILITGANGQLGVELYNKLIKFKTNELLIAGRKELDVLDADKARRFVAAFIPDVVINCAAFNAVEASEVEIERAYNINAIGAKNLAIAANEVGAKIVYISTDYVFDGSKSSPYIEADIPCPLNIYGISKSMGESYVINSNPQHFIVRTAWLYGEGKNFVRTMLSLSKTISNLKVVNDQIGSPTSTVELAKAIIQLANTDLYGIYHATCEGQCTWYEFAKEIFSLSNIEVDVQPCTSADFPQKAKRPAYSVLENANLKHRLNYRFPHWKQALTEYLSKELL